MRISQASGLLFDATLESVPYEEPPKGTFAGRMNCDKLSGIKDRGTFESSLSFLFA